MRMPLPFGIVEVVADDFNRSETDRAAGLRRRRAVAARRPTALHQRQPDIAVQARRAALAAVSVADRAVRIVAVEAPRRYAPPPLSGRLSSDQDADELQPVRPVSPRGPSSSSRRTASSSTASSRMQVAGLVTRRV